VKVGIALSGGIDSSFAGWILKSQGFSLIGIFFKTLYTPEEQIFAAKRVADTLEIPLHILDVSKEFEKFVVKRFVQEYEKGRTPNPCVFCNRFIKFGLMWEKCKELGAEQLATGHYVRKETFKGVWLLKRGIDPNKDQSYFLGLISPRLIKDLVFPLGDFFKKEVEAKVKEVFSFLKGSSSQDICFLKNLSLKDFLKRFIPERRGKVVFKGKVVGIHPGYQFFTIGQRKGLNIPLGKPAYVVQIVPEENLIVLGEKEDLLESSFFIENFNEFLPVMQWKEPIYVKVRYRSPLYKLKKLIPHGERWQVMLEEPAQAITPGQVCAFYYKDFLLGAGIISKPLK